MSRIRTKQEQGLNVLSRALGVKERQGSRKIKKAKAQINKIKTQEQQIQSKLKNFLKKTKAKGKLQKTSGELQLEHKNITALKKHQGEVKKIIQGKLEGFQELKGQKNILDKRIEFVDKSLAEITELKSEIANTDFAESLLQNKLNKQRAQLDRPLAEIRENKVEVASFQDLSAAGASNESNVVQTENVNLESSAERSDAKGEQNEGSQKERMKRNAENFSAEDKASLKTIDLQYDTENGSEIALHLEQEQGVGLKVELSKQHSLTKNEILQLSRKLRAAGYQKISINGAQYV